MLLILVVAAVLVASTSETKASGGCGRVEAAYPQGEGGAGVTILRRQGVSCSRARRLMRACITQPRVRGWHAAPAAHSYPDYVLYRGTLRSYTVFVAFRLTAGGSPNCLHRFW